MKVRLGAGARTVVPLRLHDREWDTDWRTGKWLYPELVPSHIT